MKITPIEIRQKDFQKAFRGYEKEEVDAFLLSLSQEWERVMEDNKEIRRKIENAEKEVARLREVENSLFRTLKTAEDTGAHMIDNANKTAELHLREAQMNAEAIMNEAKSKAKNVIEEAEEKSKEILYDLQDATKSLHSEYNYLLNQRDNLLQDLKNLANDTLEKVSRTLSRNKGLEEKVKDVKAYSIESKSGIKEETEVKNYSKPVSAEVPVKEEKRDVTGNFFDSIK